MCHQSALKNEYVSSGVGANCLIGWQPSKPCVEITWFILSWFFLSKAYPRDFFHNCSLWPYYFRKVEFCKVFELILTLFWPYFGKSWVLQAISPYFDLILTLFWKSRVLQAIWPYFDLILTLFCKSRVLQAIWPYFDLILTLFWKCWVLQDFSSFWRHFEFISENCSCAHPHRPFDWNAQKRRPKEYKWLCILYIYEWIWWNNIIFQWMTHMFPYLSSDK